VSAKLSPTQWYSLSPEVFSNGRMSTVSAAACGAAARAAEANGTHSRRAARSEAAVRLNIIINMSSRALKAPVWHTGGVGASAGVVGQTVAASKDYGPSPGGVGGAHARPAGTR
jgi:hypothetical protein